MPITPISKRLQGNRKRKSPVFWGGRRKWGQLIFSVSLDKSMMELSDSLLSNLFTFSRILIHTSTFNVLMVPILDPPENKQQPQTITAHLCLVISWVFWASSQSAPACSRILWEFFKKKGNVLLPKIYSFWKQQHPSCIQEPIPGPSVKTPANIRDYLSVF